MSLTPHTSTTACAQHVTLLCQGVLIREGAALYPCNRVWYSAFIALFERDSSWHIKQHPMSVQKLSIEHIG